MDGAEVYFYGGAGVDKVVVDDCNGGFVSTVSSQVQQTLDSHVLQCLDALLDHTSNLSTFLQTSFQVIGKDITRICCVIVFKDKLQLTGQGRRCGFSPRRDL